MKSSFSPLKSALLILFFAIISTAIVHAQFCASDNFNSGIDMSQWNTVTGTASTSCGSVSGSALYFNNSGTREARTNGLNVINGGQIDFYIKIANGSSPCEDANPGENVRLEYSLNGGTTWDSIRTYFESGNSTFTSISENMPAAAWSSNTIFRLRQLAHSGTGSDNWALDNVQITCVSNVPPTVKFSASPIYTCTGTVNFTDSSCCNITSRLWKFGDGATDTSKNPSHTYSNIGTYSVTLIATNVYGTDSLVKTNYITYDTAGPVAIGCTPATTAYCCGYGILNVALNGINNSSSDGSVGYEDFTCTSTSLTEGKNYSISIQTGPNEPENTRVWIDYNNDGTLNNSTELVFSANNVYNPSGTISIPMTAVLNTPLRMRISSDDISNFPIPCSNLSSSQAEDYTVMIVPNTDPPIADFSADDTSSCDGIINFTDLSTIDATSWFWNFGDGDTSTSQNPTNTYSATGTYSIKLKACNTYGCDSLTKTNYIKVNSLTGGPIAASCTPVTTGYCCGMGIYNVTLNTINNTTSDGIESYQNYSCSLQTNLTAGVSYSINIRTGTSYNENVRVWIDYNNNGVFDTTTELAFSSNNVLQYHSGTITIPGTAIQNTSLRMRVASDYFFISVPSPCANPTYGQIEDYGITVLPNTNPPDAMFTADVTTTCNGIISFTDTSDFAPTSWVWDIDNNGTVDYTTQNPTHTYTTTGLKTVKLKVCNTNGCDSLTKTNYINVTLGGPVAASCSPTTTSYCCGIGIYNVTLNAINNTTSDGIDSYQDYSCSQQTNLTAGVNYTISIETGNSYNENVRIWIDYNNNSVFNASSELAFSSNNMMQYHSGTIVIPGTAVQNTPLRMRVYSDYYDTTLVSVPAPCTNPDYGQIEDYAITVLPNSNPPSADFTANKTITCDGTINFTDLSQNIPASWLWTFGDGTTSTSQNPSHTYTTTGLKTVKLKVCNSFGCDSITKTNYINVSGLNGPISASCTPGTQFPTTWNGVYNVSLSSINNSTSSGTGYQDYSCSQQTSLTSGVAYNITIATGVGNYEDARVWIDYNNDGVFNNTSELVFSSDDQYQYHYGTITPPGTAVQNTQLRMRVLGDDWGGYTPCTDAYYGQFEDYAVTIVPNTNPPVAKFTADYTTTCNGIISFTDTSTMIPTSWLWTFGDGTTSTSQNPIHTYSSSGVFTVKLKCCNANGCDSLTKTNYINVTLGGPISASCTPNTLAYCCGMGIYNVTLNTINNTTADGIEGYQDYSCSQQTNLIAGNNYSISIETGNNYNEDVRVWIDYNNNGVLNNTTELAFSSNNIMQYHSGTIVIPATAVKNTSLRMRVYSDYSGMGPGPCVNPDYGQIEDYGIKVYDNNIPPVADYTYLILDSCQGIVSFTDQSAVNPTSWSWNFGDGNISTQQNPYHTFTSSGTYAIQLIATNSFGNDTILKSVTVNSIMKADFNYTFINSTTISFTDNSTGAVSWDWDFGDGNLSTLQNPTNIYASAGTYTVKLKVTNSSGCIAQVVKIIYPLGLNNAGTDETLRVFPNPTNGEINIDYTFAGQKNINVTVQNILGQIIYGEKTENASHYKQTINLTAQPKGIYFVKVQNGERQFIEKVVVE